MKIALKLFVGFLTIFFFVGVIVFFGIRSLTTIPGQFESMVEEEIPVVKAIEDLKSSGLMVVILTSEHPLLMKDSNLKPRILIIEADQLVESAYIFLNEDVERYEEAVQKLFEHDIEIYKHIKTAAKHLNKTSAELLTLKRRGASELELSIKNRDFQEVQENFLKSISAALEHQDDEFMSRKRTIESSLTKSINTLLFACLIAFIISIVVIFYFSYSVSSPIIKLKDAALKIGKGEIDTPIDIQSRDEVGILAGALRKMVQDLKNTTVSKKYVDNIIRSMLDCLIIIAPDRTIRFVNPAALKLMEFEEQELVEKDISELFSPEILNELCLNKGSFSEKGVRYIEVSHVTRSGKEIPISLSSTLMLDDNGKMQGVIIVANDISERKKEIEELKNAQKASEEANLAKSHFLANMSHEIRTPMNGVLGMLELLLFHTELTPQQQNFAESSFQAGKTLLNLINSILDFSKIEAGKIELEYVDFDLRLMVEEVVELLAETAYRKKLELACIIPHDVPTRLKGDPGRLRQIITNLVGNAIKFTWEGEVVVQVTSLEDTEDKVLLRFEVRDTGIGISPQVQERIFESFSQADGSTSRKYGGTGLGLTISKELIACMGGNIGVDSVPGQGSTFWFVIQFDKSTEAPLACPTIDDLTNLRALIVDDNSTNRAVLENLLTSLGIHHDSAENGYDALEMARAAVANRTPYALAILDIKMPGMDEMELTRAIKADPAISDIRVIVFTFFGNSEGSKEAREAGVAGYLTKPMRQCQLYDCINLVMGIPGEATHSKLVTSHNLKELNDVFIGNILLVEDNPLNQKVAQCMLESLGCQTHVATNGLEAIEALSHTTYDLILMDCQMPEMDGFEATRVIREKQKTEEKVQGKKAPHLPIIALTAYALQEDRERCLAAGMDDYLNKPITQTQLSAVLKPWLNRRTETNIKLDRKEEEPETSLTEPTEHRFNHRILIAEDDPINQNLLKFMMEKLNCRVDIASDGRKALEALAREKYDLVFMDCSMPEMDGLEATKTLRKKEKTECSASDTPSPRIPVIAVTGFNEKSMGEECKASGMDDFLFKPYQMDQVINILEKWLPQKSDVAVLPERGK